MKKNWFSWLTATCMVLLMFTLGCLGMGSTDRTQEKQQEQLSAEANRQVGMPAITNFQERKLAKMIMELRDQNDLVCYAYIKSEYTGKLVYLGKCIGFGLPYSVQFTNPMRYEYQGATLPQADPNGLFMPESAAATWVMLIDPSTNEPSPCYIESDVLISPFPLPSSVCVN